ATGQLTPPELECELLRSRLLSSERSKRPLPPASSDGNSEVRARSAVNWARRTRIAAAARSLLVRSASSTRVFKVGSAKLRHQGPAGSSGGASAAALAHCTGTWADGGV